ncbi:hypothetical protein Dimus_027952 [Dionaea muscipula]
MTQQQQDRPTTAMASASLNAAAMFGRAVVVEGYGAVVVEGSGDSGRRATLASVQRRVLKVACVDLNAVEETVGLRWRYSARPVLVRRRPWWLVMGGGGGGQVDAGDLSPFSVSSQKKNTQKRGKIVFNS